MIVFTIAGFALLAMAVLRGLQAWVADQRMQRFRVPGESFGSYLFVPLRWQKHLYSPDGERFVTEAWRRTGAMYGYGLVGMLLFAIGNA